MRKFPRVGGMETDHFKQLVDARANCALAAPAGGRVLRAKRPDRLGDDAACPPARIERSERVLEDHLHAPAHRALRGAVSGLCQIDAIDDDLPPARLDEPDHHARQRRFA